MPGSVLALVSACPVPVSGHTVEEVLRGIAQGADAEVAVAITEIARAELGQARSQKAPNIKIDAQGDVAGDPDPTEPEYVLQAEQMLFDWGNADESIAGRRSAMDASASGEREALLDAGLRSLEAFYGVGAVNAKLLAHKNTRDSLTELRDMMRRRVESNVSPGIELEEVIIRLDLLEISEQRLASEKRRHQLLLKRLTGLDVDTPVMSDCSVAQPRDEEALIRSALAISPTLERIRHQAEVHLSDARALGASSLPSLVAGYRSDSQLNGADFDQRAYIALRYRFQAGGEVQSRVAAQRAMYLEQQALLRKEAETVTQTVGAWVSAYQTSISLVGVYDRVMASKLKQKESHLRRFLAGRSSWRDVLNSQQEIADTRVSRIDSEITVCLAAKSLDLLSSGAGVFGR